MRRANDFYNWRVKVAEKDIKIDFKTRGALHLVHKTLNIGKCPKYRVFIRDPKCIKKEPFRRVIEKLSKYSYQSWVLDQSKSDKYWKLSYLMPDLSRSLSKCLGHIRINAFVFTKRDLQHFINSSFNWKTLGFDGCIFLFKDISFISKGKSKLERIEMGYCELNKTRYDKLKGFNSFIKALSNSIFKESLQRIDFLPNGLREKTCLPILKSEGMVEIFYFRQLR